MSSPVGQKVADPALGTGVKRLNWLTLPITLSLILGGATAWSSMQQSLWIDELHTAWVSTGPWSEVTARAAAGNQTPIYFAWQWWLGRTFGYSEFGLRATSLVAWLGSLALLAAMVGKLAHATAHTSLWCMVCLVALDRHQIFFATEARPYMLMSLVVLLGWLALDFCSNTVNARAGRLWAWSAWVACGAAAMWLQPTAVLFVSAQMALAMWRAGTRWSKQVPIGMAIVILIGLLWPMRYVLEPAWQERQAWSAFAADLRWVNVLKQFPILVVGVPGAIAAAVHWIVEGSGQRAVGSSHRAVDDREAAGVGGLWFCGWAWPLGMVIILTALGVAPLMHARYLYAATLPLTLWTTSMLSRLRSGRTVAIVVCGMILLQAVQQGSWQAWVSGQLPVVDRGERWREAVACINQHERDQATTAQIYCAASLIEGSRSDFLDGRELRENYLSLPLRTLYPVSESAKAVSLLNDPRTWPAIVSRHFVPGSTRWLLVRTSKAGLAKRLQLSGLQPMEQFDFGAVQLVRF